MADQRAGGDAGEIAWPVTGLHHVRLPVSDPWTSKEWYSRVLGFVPVMDVERETSVVGVVLRHTTGLVIGLHEDTARARALRGFAVLSLAVADRVQLGKWGELLSEAGVPHSPVMEGHLGEYLEIPDPDGILVLFHCGAAPYAEEA